MTVAPKHDSSCTMLNDRCIGFHCPNCGRACGPQGHAYRSRVKITSGMTGESWEGRVELDGCAIRDKLEPAFRFFNRVDEADVKRLEKIGYRLPSLSAGDTIVIDSVPFRVDPVGFSRLPW